MVPYVHWIYRKLNTHHDNSITWSLFTTVKGRKVRYHATHRIKKTNAHCVCKQELFRNIVLDFAGAYQRFFKVIVDTLAEICKVFKKPTWRYFRMKMLSLKSFARAVCHLLPQRDFLRCLSQWIVADVTWSLTWLTWVPIRKLALLPSFLYSI